MWDDQNDKEMMRNQILAIVVVSVLFLVYFNFFMPQPVPVQAPPPQEQSTDVAGLRPDERAPRETASTTDPAREATPGVWPYLPPVPEQLDPFEDEVILRDADLELVFTRIGGRLKQARVLLGENGDDTVELIPETLDIPDTEAVYPLGLRFTDDSLGDEIDKRRFEYVLDPSGLSVTFTLELPGAAVIRKSFNLTQRRHVLDVEIEYENLEDGPRKLGLDVIPAYILNWAPGLSDGDEDGRFQSTFIWRRGIENESMQPKKVPDSVDSSGYKRIPTADWVAYRTKYFMAALKPEFNPSDAWIRGDASEQFLGVSAPKFQLGPGAVQSHRYSVYVGPMHLGSLSEAWENLPSALRFFESVDSMDWFAKLLLRNLNWWYGFIPNYGVAIILLTVLVRLIMLPLTIKSMRSMKRMQILAPEMKELQEKYKDDQQELGRKTMELYKERGINPLSGCFPLLLQMPVFFALYRMLWNAFELRSAPFLWIDDLSQTDRLFHISFLKDLPLISYFEYFNLLPLLSCLAMVASMKLAPTSGPANNPQQKMMMRIMSIFFAVIMYNIASGLNLYVFTSTVLGMAQQYFVKPAISKEAEKPKKSIQDKRKKRKQHFYTRAKERQRQLAKEAKKKQKVK